MTATADTLAPAGMTWIQAMEHAADALSKTEGLLTGKSIAWTPIKAAQAQAWIAYAREITMHARAQ